MKCIIILLPKQNLPPHC